MITPGRETVFSLRFKGKSGNRLTVTYQHSCCLKLLRIQCLSQGHLVGVDSCHHKGILQPQCGFPIKQTTRTDTGSVHDILDSFCSYFLSFYWERDTTGPLLVQTIAAVVNGLSCFTDRFGRECEDCDVGIPSYSSENDKQL